jgi:hypothetical protein
MKVIGLSGAQGSGKSSMLKELMLRGWRLDEFRVSRAVQAQLGWDTLDRVLESPETMMAFQEEVFQQKYQRDFGLATDGSNSIILTERTFADIWAYASHWTWTFHDRGDVTFRQAIDFITPYLEKCIEAQNTIYSGALMLPLMEHIIWEDDPNRAKKNIANSIYEDVVRFMERKMKITIQRHEIYSQSVADRATEVEHFLRKI